MPSTKEILEERGPDYGDFGDLSELVQELKGLVNSRSPRYSPVMREALDMICLKIGRLATGNPSKTDTWQDIAGYAELVVRELSSPMVARPNKGE